MAIPLRHPEISTAPSVWTAGDFLQIARSFAPAAAEFIARLRLCPGESVLDVACGTGNLAIPAAWAGARVIGVEVGDAESLPYGDDRFDTTVSMFGVMFAARPERAAAELVRVTRPGGRVALANWTREGFIGAILRAHTDVVPAPRGVPSPLAWGNPEVVSARLGDRIATLICTRRVLELRFALPPAAVTELFAACYGPTIATLRATDRRGSERLRAELTRLFNDYNLADDGTTLVASEYLDVLARVA